MLIEKPKKNKDYELGQPVLTQKLSKAMLDALCCYVVSENRSIQLKGYMNIRSLMNMIDMNDYKDIREQQRISFILLGLEARIDRGVLLAEQAFDYVLTFGDTKPTEYDIPLNELSNQEVDYVDITVNQLLNSAEFGATIHTFDDMAKDYDTANPYERQEIINTWKTKIDECQQAIINNSIEKAEESYMSLEDGNFDVYAKDTYAYMSSESSQLYTGMQGINYLLGGGFEPGRVYGFFGLQGEGKSTTLLNLAFQIKQYNKKYKTKDPTKKPAVVYLTLENTKRETFTRLFSMTTNAGKITDYDSNEVVNMMRQNGLSVSPDNPIDIIVKYKPQSSISTSYLYEFAKELEANGYEIICYIVDYINVIRSANFHASEERLRLGSVIMEFKAIAASLDIPIITAGQLNREANKKVDEARSRGEYNMLDKIDRSNLGESMLILNNLDAAFIITPSYVMTECLNEKYLAIKLIKQRYQVELKPLNYQYGLYQPYENMDSISLVCDVGKKPVYELDLSYKHVEKCRIDDNVQVPDNSLRFKSFVYDDEDNRPSEIPQPPVVLYPDGSKPIYNVYWRTNPKEINGIPNIDGYCPEKQLRIKLREDAFKNVLDPRINSLNGVSRYSDEYTFLYDAEGSKEERLSHDYSIKYGRKFTKEDFPMLYSHFMGLQNKEIPDTETFEEPTKTYKVPNTIELGIFIPDIDYDAYQLAVDTKLKKCQKKKI